MKNFILTKNKSQNRDLDMLQIPGLISLSKEDCELINGGYDSWIYKGVKAFVKSFRCGCSDAGSEGVSSVYGDYGAA